MAFFVHGLVGEAKKGIAASTMFYLRRKKSKPSWYNNCMLVTYKIKDTFVGRNKNIIFDHTHI